MLSYDRLQHILACFFGLGLIVSGIMRRGMGVRGLPEVSEQNDPPPFEFSVALIVLGVVIWDMAVFAFFDNPQQTFIRALGETPRCD